MGKIFAFSGPRGVGKTSILDDLRERCGIEPIVPYTTRPPRDGEVDGRDYRFVGHNEFHSIRSNDGGMFDVLTLGDNHYGTPYKVFEDALGVSDTSVAGLRTVNLAAETALRLRSELGPRGVDLAEGEAAVHSLFVLPQSFRDIRRQMIEKGVPEQQVEERLANEPTDLTMLPQFDAIIVNGYGRREGAFRAAARYIMEVTGIDLPNVDSVE